MVAPSIFRSLALIFNYSIFSSCFPNEWKEANVSAVPKSRDSNDVKNYCPISVIPVFGKVFESLVHQQLYSYLDENHLLRENQSGFRPNRSTQDVLLKTIDDWKLALDDNKIVASVLIDLSKAFDTIDHDLLLQKLHAYGVRGSELNWFSNYLSGRKQCVVIDGVASE